MNARRPAAALLAAAALAALAPGRGAARLTRRVVAGQERWPAGTTAEASSAAAGHDAAAAIDGTTDTAWIDGTPNQGPDTLTVTTAAPRTLPGVTVVSDTRNWPRAFEVATRHDGRWVRQETVTGGDELTRAG